MRRLTLRCLHLVAALALSVVGVTSMPVDAGAEPAFTRTADDPALEWGACPDLFPDGCEIAVLQGDPAEPNADVFFRVPGEYDLPEHWHTSAERMVLVTGKMRIAYEGQDPVTLNPGTYAYGPVKKPHGGRCVSEEPCTLFIAFEEPVDAHAGAPSSAP